MNGYRLIWILSLLLLQRAYTQPTLRYQQFTTDQRLSENVVYALLQDKKGFIWIGTHHGLNRFDGYSFTRYYASNTDSTTISDNTIHALAEDHQGRVWIGTQQGLNCYDPSNGKFKRVEHAVLGTDYVVQNIFLANDDKLLLKVFPDKVLAYHTRTNSWEEEGRSFPTAAVLFRLPDGRAGIFDSSRCYAYTGSRWDTYTFPFKLAEHPFLYYNDANGNHYVYSANRFEIFNKAGKVLHNLPAYQKKSGIMMVITSIRESENGITWIVSNNGLLRFDQRSLKIDYPAMEGDSRSLKGNKEIRCAMVDREKNLWMGTFGEGVLKCQIRQTPFSSIDLGKITAEKFSRMIFGLYDWKDGSIAAETGFVNYSIIRDQKVWGHITTRTMPMESIVYKTLGRNFHSIPAKQQNILRKLYQDNKLAPFHFFIPDSNHIILTLSSFCVASDTGLRCIGEYTTSVYEDDAYYWCATTSGLLRIGKKDFSEKIYMNDPADPYSLSENSLYVVTCIGNDLWIGTKGGGLNRFNKKEERFYHYTTDNGLPDNVIYFIVYDQKENLWLSTNNGLSRFNLRTGTFKNFSRRDGLLNTEFNRSGGLLTSDGYLCFSGTNGIDIFKPSEVEDLNHIPGICFSSITVNDEQIFGYQEKSLFGNDISFSFTANDFIRPDLIYYRYRLKQKDPWTRVQGVNSVRYNSLPPGSYRFEVAASYDNYNWSTPAVYNFSIPAPWWQKWWFYAAVFLFILAALWMFYRYRINQLKKIQSMRSRISQDLHDEVGATLSSIHVYSSVATRAMEKDRDKANHALQQIHRNTREAMENMNDIVWAMNATQFKESTLESKLKNYGYELLTPLNIQCHYHIDKEAEKRLKDIELRKNLLLIAKEAMNNIAKHSGATEARVQLYLTGKDLVLEIYDNGNGLPEALQKNGNGLRNMHTRAKAMGGLLEYSTSGKGTAISCMVPIAKISDAW